ncbi:MAG: hypothetical protein P0S93_04075 [Candidatus Neptunochlamydia sp.]|nr:hypothetical protein [Candidatus Neptunochlamydia sp.]
MTNEERLESLSGFRNGKYEVLTNCQLLTEGFDEPGNAWARKHDPAAPKQKEALSKCRIPFDQNISKGQASELLDSRLSEPATFINKN